MMGWLFLNFGELESCKERTGRMFLMAFVEYL